MRVAGVICEYNPFHNGHARHLRALREASGCDYIVCAMAGAFTQRGEAALLSKWARAEMALRGGADAVVELPTLFAVRDAERFARGGVALLHALGVVTHLGFGSECGDLEALQHRAAVTPDLAIIRAGLAEGKSLSRIHREAMETPADAPNDTLAVQYLRAINTLGAPMEPILTSREGAAYHDGALQPLASASAIRAAVWRGESVAGAMPGAAFALLERHLSAGACHAPGALDQALLALLRTLPPAAIARAADIGEGLEHRIARAAQEATDRETLLALIKSKRYTRARLSRVLTQILLGLTRELAAQNLAPGYARLLGFRAEAAPLMRAIKGSAAIPLVTRVAPARAALGEALALDVRAGDLWALGRTEKGCRAGHADLTERVVIV
ncbi:MAG: nucleotidyltransferase family protein [Oscillospiraceae bacterium]|jgi:predicted nucleotidyltransferase|nr:nucleotidyltransferase family protein [Oscillospiraceae bacterium]